MNLSKYLQFKYIENWAWRLEIDTYCKKYSHRQRKINLHCFKVFSSFYQWSEVRDKMDDYYSRKWFYTLKADYRFPAIIPAIDVIIITPLDECMFKIAILTMTRYVSYL